VNVEIRALDPTPGTAATPAPDPNPDEAAIPALAALILDAVADGTGVNFLTGATLDETAAWWFERAPLVDDGTLTAFAAVETDGTDRPEQIVGSAILIRSRNQNAPHRAEVGKVIVLRSHRRRGIARRLMAAVEARARADGRWLLLLDTVADSGAEALYRQLGWTAFGRVPDHALRPDGTPAATTYFYKDLR
jgi:GNAT superfamily N-acetyltransferase